MIDDEKNIFKYYIEFVLRKYGINWKRGVRKMLSRIYSNVSLNMKKWSAMRW